MDRFSIVEVTNPKWTELILLSYQYDFYHTQAYSLLERDHEPILCVAWKNDNFIAIPLIKRKIEGTEFFDCTSVYGYCGPVSNLPYNRIDEDHIRFFQSEINSFFRDNNIVSVFSRLHPILDQTRIFKDFGSIKIINKTVAIDLSLSIAEQYMQYRRNHKRDIKKLIELGFIVAEAGNDKELDSFIKIYNDSMRRINADSFYFFDKQYFKQFLDSPYIDSVLLLVKIKNVIVGGGIFTFTKDIMQAHLAADAMEFKHFAPMKLVYNEARLIGYNRNMNVLHLGGGLKGSSNDQLFNFKLGFSKNLFDFKGWQLIVDHEKYSYLIDLLKVENNRDVNYFPQYRAG